MAEVIRYVDPDAVGTGTGVDWTNAYTSLSVWNNTERVDLPLAGDWHHVYCRASSGTADTTTATINGWTTDVTHYVLIEAADEDQAIKSGWDTSRYRLSTNTATAMNINDEFIRVKGLQLESADGSSKTMWLRFNGAGTEIQINSCRFQGDVNVSGIDIADADISIDIFNCILTGYTGAFKPAIVFNGATLINVYNCILYGNELGIRSLSGTTRNVYNTASFNNATDFDGTYDVLDHCATDDGDGTNPVAPSGGDWINEYTNPAAGDFTLLNSGNTFHGGADNPSSGLYTTDMEGDAYNVGGYSIGVDEFVSVVTDVFFEMLSQIEQGIKPLTAAGLGGVLQE